MRRMQNFVVEVVLMVRSTVRLGQSYSRLASGWAVALAEARVLHPAIGLQHGLSFMLLAQFIRMVDAVSRKLCVPLIALPHPS